MRNKTPYLTGFSARLCGGAKASAQARIAAQYRRTAANTIADSARMFAPVLDPALMQDLAQGRQRSFDAVTTFWAWTGQILGGNSSCARAVGQVQSWCAESGRSVPSSNTAAYCAARARLPWSFLHAVHARLAGAMAARRRDEDLWHGMALKAIDGSSVRLADTLENQGHYPQPSGQKPGCGFPVMGFVGVVDLSSGAWLGAATGTCNTHDSSLAGEVIHHFGEGDLVLADRAFNSYELVARLAQRGCHSLMRLHQNRHRKLDWGCGKKPGPCERLVEWRKPERMARGTRLEQAAWDALPATLSLRYIRFRFENRSGERSEMVLVTTLLDSQAHDWTDLAVLYASRWEVELKLRDVKTTLGMESFGVRSPEMARKTLLVMMIAHNLARSMMQRAAIQGSCTLRAISFKGSLGLLDAWRARHRGRNHHVRVMVCLDTELLELLATKVVPQRPFRHEPRVIKLRPKQYSRLGVPRHQCREAMHRSARRQPALS